MDFILEKDRQSIHADDFFAIANQLLSENDTV